MVFVSDQSQLHRINHPGIHHLVAIRLEQLGSDAPTSTELIVVEPKDAAFDIEQAAGITILTSLLNDLPFDHGDFYPNHEYLEKYLYENTCFYEMVFGCGEDGAVAIFIPDQEGIDVCLLALCRSWAAPALSTP